MSNFNFHEPYQEKKQQVNYFSIITLVLLIVLVLYIAYFMIDNVSKQKALDDRINELNTKLEDKSFLKAAEDVKKLDKFIAQAEEELLVLDTLNLTYKMNNAIDIPKLNKIVTSLVDKYYLVSIEVIDQQCIIVGRVSEPLAIDDLPYFMDNLQREVEDTVPGIVQVTRFGDNAEEDFIEFEIKIEL